MIKFFRKIRKKLADDNKPVKYFRYAIGEILLVVIGILIALSINNWNIQQIEQNEERNYLTRLVQDLKWDINELKAVVKENQSRLYQCSVTLDMLDAHNIPYERMKLQERTRELEIDTSSILKRTFGFGLTAIRYYSKFNISDATYRELLANGKIDLIQDKQLKISVVDYYSNMENRLQLVRKIEMMRDNYVQTLAIQGISMYNIMSYKEFDNLVPNKANIIAEIENIFYITGANQGALKFGKRSMEKRTKELILKIENYLSN